MIIGYFYSKKAISSLIATVLIVLITISSTAIISVSVLPVIRTNLDLNKECTEAKLNIEMQAGYSCFYKDVQKIGVMISSPAGEFNLSGIQVIIKGGGKTESIEIRESIARTNEKVTYLLSTNLNDIEEVSVAPIVLLGNKDRRCGVTSRISRPSFVECPPGTTPVGIGVGGDCIDGIQNGDETGTDCGGRCITGTESLCSDGIDNDNDCLIDTPDPDCPDCSDGIKNQDETDIDCGGIICSKCVDGKACLIGTDCQSNYCLGGICTTPTCSDGIQNGDETGIDCGGSCISGTETLCSDGIDNDKDCLIDAADSDCGPVTYRRPVTITENSGSALTDHQVLISLDTASLISAGKMRADCGDIRFFDTDGTTPLSYWVESGCNTGSTKIWTKVPSIPASSIKTIYVDYGDPSLTSQSSVPNTFIANSVYLRSGSCSSSTYCGYMDNHAEADVVRGYASNICNNYVNRIYWGSVCDSSNPGSSVREFFYSDFKFLFLPDASGSWRFAVDSDDGSELIRNREDRDLDHTVITSWYAGHGWCNCQSHNGLISLTANQAVWLEYLQEEWQGGEAAVVWTLKPGGSWASLTATNFPNSLFARKYASPEPTTNVGAEI